MKTKQLFTEAHAKMVQAGRPEKYRPSNGDEGDRFQSMWCWHCVKENPVRPCPILSATYEYNLADSEYPKEWTYDEDGQPICTAYAAKQEKFIKVSLEGGSHYIQPHGKLRDAIIGELDGAEVGTLVILEVVAMTHDEYKDKC